MRLRIPGDIGERSIENDRYPLSPLIQTLRGILDDWLKKPFPGQGIFEYYRQEFEKLQRQTETEETWVRLRAPPPGIGAVQTGPNRHYNVRPDGTFEMPADDAAFLIPRGWTKIAEWTRQHAV